MNKNPTLSVAMPNYNYGQYIGEALEAILNQSYPPDELIIVDDCSTDGSVAVIESCIKDHPNARMLKNEKNMGVIYTMNRALLEAKGDYIHTTASDDIVLAGFYEKSMKLLMEYPQAGLCCADNVLFDPCGCIEDRPGYSNKPAYFSPEEVVKLSLRRIFTASTANTVIIKRSSVIEAGGYIPSLKHLSDSFVNSVVSFRHGICYIPEILAKMRIHPGQFGGTQASKLRLEREVIKNTLNIVMSPKYQDVLPMFRRAAPFSSYPFEVLKVVAGDKKYRDFISFKLLRFALFDIFKRGLKMLLPKRAYYLFAGGCKRIRRIFK